VAPGHDFGLTGKTARAFYHYVSENIAMTIQQNSVVGRRRATAFPKSRTEKEAE
jgi:hypothetical protein